MKSYVYPRLPDDEYYAVMGEFKRSVGRLLAMTFRMYGYQDDVPGVTGQIVDLAEQLGMRLRGKQQPIELSNRITDGGPDD